MLEYIECKKCINSTANPTIHINENGLCDICKRYEESFNIDQLKKDLELFLSFRDSNRYDVLVGISGGKDSTAVLYDVQKMGFNPLAFSFDTGYYPKQIFRRAADVALKFGVEYEKIDVRQYIRDIDRVCFQKTAELYSEDDPNKFKEWYIKGRKSYSVKNEDQMPFVRTCQLCRKIIIRAYYAEAIKHGVNVVVLGMNEWAGLSQDNQSDKYLFSAIRKLCPSKDSPPVYIVHLPFLLQRTIKDTEKTLIKLSWRIPPGERLIESNANSCLFARAAENQATQLLGFHPDTTRLARECTVGFLNKKQAKRALSKVHRTKRSVKDILEKAGIL